MRRAERVLPTKPAAPVTSAFTATPSSNVSRFHAQRAWPSASPPAQPTVRKRPGHCSPGDGARPGEIGSREVLGQRRFPRGAQLGKPDAERALDVEVAL